MRSDFFFLPAFRWQRQLLVNAKLAEDLFLTSLPRSDLNVYAALSYECMRPCATSVEGLKLLGYEAFRY
jgi:hypothetical protein